jgi:hypothetical protein
MSGKKGSATTGEYLGTALTGGEVHPLVAGDIVHIPAGIPHAGWQAHYLRSAEIPGSRALIRLAWCESAPFRPSRTAYV